jgi:hypothetical protein
VWQEKQIKILQTPTNNELCEKIAALVKCPGNNFIINEKKHTTFHIFGLIVMDRVAAYTLHHFFIVCGFCADAGRD